jgi:hypothetical protein
LITRKRTFFDEQRWKTLPWSSELCKSAGDYLLDILADVPGIVQQLEAPQPIDELSKERIRAHIADLMSQLSEWRWAWETTNSSSMRDVQSRLNPDGIGRGAIRSLSARALYFDSVALAIEHILYNATLLWLMRLRSTLMGQESGFDNSLERNRQDSDLIERAYILLPVETRFFVEPAVEILRSLEYGGARQKNCTMYALGIKIYPLTRKLAEEFLYR